FLEDASEIVLERVQCIMQRYDAIKINTIFNGEFVAGDKRANKSIATRNYELYRYSDLREWYVTRVVEPILTSLEEFQERDSGWALSRILNLAVNANKHNPLRAGCHIKLPREIMLKRAVINVQSTDNACFAWSVVAALHPAQKNVERESSYPHYSSVLNLQDIQFPMTLSQIRKFEALNNISINVYAIEKGIVPIRLTDRKRSKHVNLLYVEDDSPGHFAVIKNLPRLVRSQITRNKNRKYFFNRNPINKIISNLKDMLKRWKSKGFINDNKYNWLNSTNPILPRVYGVPKVHKINNPIGYYVQCSYDSSLSGYRFRRDKDCIAWFAEELRQLAHSIQTIISANVPMADFTRNDWEKFNSASHCHVCEKPDAHFIIKEIATAYEGRVDLLPITKEKYTSISFTKHVDSTKIDQKNCVQLRFIDSYRFLASSLDKLSSFLSKDKLRVLRRECSNLSEENFNFLIRKGVFPYEYIDCSKKLNELYLPPRESFYSIMTEFVGLKAKMYALRVQRKKDAKKAKGVKSSVVAKSITFEDYTCCLNDAIEMTRRQSCIISKLHEVYTISETKIALSPHDDKRYIVSGSTNTLPWGHYRCK
ncbi:hypothetical protein ALC57_18047, partial [Trachymyrmex cornetzi]